MFSILGAVERQFSTFLAARSVLPHRRLSHVVTALGDSRVAAVYADLNQRIYSGYSPLNWANALSDQRMVIGTTFGVSGDRTDQALARLSAAIATGAGTLYIQCGLNDIAQQYPTAGTSGATAAANIMVMAEAARAVGMLVVIEIEVGSSAMNTAALVGQVVELNERLYEYAERTPGVHLHDARPIVLQADYSATALAYRTNYTYDGTTHVNARGAYYWGKSLATLLQAIMSPRFGMRIINRADAPSNGRRNYLDSPVFVPATGGTTQNGTTGTLPASWLGTKNAGATVAFSTQDDAAGNGKNIVMAATFAAQADYGRIFQDVNPANWDNGEIVEAVAKVTVNSPNNLATVYLNAQANIGGTSYDNMCLNSPAAQMGPDEAYTVTLKTRPFLLPAGSKGWLSCALWAQGYGAGGASVVAHHMAMRRRDVAY